MKNTSFPSAEYGLISRLQATLGEVRSERYPTAIGDDAAVRRGVAGERIVLTTDLSVEDVHFSLSYMTMEEVGYRAMVSNLSDCAAMGAVADSALVQLVIPAHGERNGEKVEALYRGFAEACRRWKFPVVGGDLSAGNQWVIGITLLGSVAPKKRTVLRRGAVSGDALWVSGCPGRSAAGLSLLQQQSRNTVAEQYRSLVEAHVRPVPRLELGSALAADPAVHAMTDLSDGLSKDSRSLSYENGCGIILSIDTSQVPDAMIQLSRERGISWEEWVFHGGEDYELLFAAAPGIDVSRYRVTDGDGGPIRIGRFDSDCEGLFVDRYGALLPVENGAFDHLRNIW